ncbi:MAG: TIGR02099 family protein [Zoogloeaceae bacterium]|nr:TIGR02099 family protein [Zoogloeaceae bacterium]
MSAIAETPARRPWGARFIRGLLWTALAVYFCFGAVVLILRYGVLPRIDDARPTIARWVTEQVGQPVEIGRLTADWSGLRPRIHLAKLTVRDGAGQPGLELDQVDAVLGWSSVLRLRPYFQRIDVTAPRLVAQRRADGRLVVAGVEIRDDSAEPGFVDWLLQQGTVTVRDARLEWADQQRQAPQLVLESVQFQMSHFLGHHRFGLQARPPAALASSLDVRGDLRGALPRPIAEWRGEVYARVDGADLRAFQPWVDLPYEAGGRGSARAWVSFGDGERQIVTDFDLAAAQVRLAPQLPVLTLVRGRGRIGLGERGDERRLDLREVSVATGDGLALGPVTVSLAQRVGTEPGGHLQASVLDLDALVRLAVFLPLNQGVVDQLASFDPTGAIHNFDANWRGTLDAPTAWKLKARFDGIGLRAWKRIPGVAGLSGDIEGSESQGRLVIQTPDLKLDLPEVFSNPRLQLAKVRAEGGWQRRSGHLEFSLDKAEFENDDASGQASGTYVPTDTGPGVIDLQARLLQANGAAVWRYMPLVVNRDTRDWLQRSIVGGTAHDARLRLKGDLRDFPFVGGRGGQFQVRARIAGARLEYAEGWPPIDDINGELLFEGASMTITANRARIFGVELMDVSTRLADLEAPEELLEIQGKASGPTPDFLRFVSESPVAQQIDHFTDDMRAEGNGRLDLRLDMPLRNTASTKVRGTFAFSGNRLVVVPELPPITEAGGRVSFTAQALTLSDGRGRFLDEPVTIRGETRSDGVVAFTAAGGASLAAARRHYGWPWLDHLAGSVGWKADVAVKSRGATVAVRSTLGGLTSSLPAPFNKRSADEWPLRVDLTLQPGGAEDAIRATLGEILAIDLRGQGEGAWHPTRGDIAVGLPLRLPERGVSFRVSRPEIDLDAWRQALDGGESESSGAEAEAGGGVTQVSLQAGTVLAFGQTVRDLNLQAGARAGGWQGTVRSKEAEGEFRWHGKDNGALTARLFRLAVGGGPEGSDDGADDPSSLRKLPSLDISVQQFLLRDKPMGRLAIMARNQSGVWHIDSLTLVNPDGDVSAKGVWRPGQPGQTDLDFKLTTADAGKLLTRLGYADALRRGTAKLEGKVRWNGGPTRVDYPSLAGQMTLAAEGGQFRKLEPGVGRLLGVLSLQSLPRRITLDFRDVFSEGFAFDRISGSIDVKAGVMRTDDLEIRGPAARVALSGTADLARESQDLVVRVQPTLSESVAIGAAASLLNPVAGVVTYLAQKALSDPIEKLFAFNYRVTGQWQDPKVEKLESGSETRPGRPE